MRLYLDDNLAARHLAGKLRAAGRDVEMPSDLGLTGEDDSIHLAHAIREQRVCLTEDYGDFENLHNLIMIAQGHHPGILVVRQDNDSKRDLKAPGIVRAIRKLLAAGVPIADEYIILNHWQ